MSTTSQSPALVFGPILGSFVDTGEDRAASILAAVWDRAEISALLSAARRVAKLAEPEQLHLHRFKRTGFDELSCVVPNLEETLYHLPNSPWRTVSLQDWSRAVRDLLRVAGPRWAHWSGDPKHPVKGADPSYVTWEGEQGALRRDLLQLLIRVLECALSKRRD